MCLISKDRPSTPTQENQFLITDKLFFRDLWLKIKDLNLNKIFITNCLPAEIKYITAFDIQMFNYFVIEMSQKHISAKVYPKIKKQSSTRKVLEKLFAAPHKSQGDCLKQKWNV